MKKKIREKSLEWNLVRSGLKKMISGQASWLKNDFVQQHMERMGSRTGVGNKKRKKEIFTPG